MTLSRRSLAFALVLALVIGGLAVVQPSDTYAETDAEDAVSDQLSQLKEMIGDGWEAGLTLKLNDTEVYPYLERFIALAPDEFYDYLEEISGTDARDLTLLDLYSIALGSDFKKFSMNGNIDALIMMDKVDSGYLCDVSFKGTLYVDAEVTQSMDGIDCTDLFDCVYTVTIGATAELDEDMILQSFSTTVVIDVSMDVVSDYTDDPDTHMVVNVDTFETHYGETATFNITLWIDDLTFEEMEDFLYGEGTIDKTIGFITEMTSVTDGANYSGSYESRQELVTSYTFPCGIMNSEVADSVAKGDSALIDMYESDGMYAVVMTILQEYGVFITPEQYDSSISILKDMWKDLRDGNLDFYYEYDGGVYNGGLASVIKDRLDDVPLNKLEPVIDADVYHLISIQSTDDGRYEITDYDCDESLLPEEYKGKELVNKHVLYTVTLGADGEYGTKRAEEGEYVFLPVLPSDEDGNAFLGWTVDGSRLWNEYYVCIGEDVTLVPVYGLDYPAGITIDGITYRISDDWGTYAIAFAFDDTDDVTIPATIMYGNMQIPVGILEGTGLSLGKVDVNSTEIMFRNVVCDELRLGGNVDDIFFDGACEIGVLEAGQLSFIIYEDGSIVISVPLSSPERMHI